MAGWMDGWTDGRITLFNMCPTRIAWKKPILIWLLIN